MIGISLFFVVKVQLNGRPRVVYQNVTTSLDLKSATIIQDIKMVCFTMLSGLFFELVAARFYSFVEATGSASHLTNREKTSYELKDNESMRSVENFCIKYENCLKRFQVVFNFGGFVI